MVRIGKYEHYKGGQYEVLGIAKHSETMEEFVAYKALYNKGELWVRPLKMFLEEVDFGGKKVKRFKYIGDIEKNNTKDPCRTNSIILTFSRM